MAFDVRDRAGLGRARCSRSAEVTNRRMNVLFNNAGICARRRVRGREARRRRPCRRHQSQRRDQRRLCGLAAARETPGSRIVNVSSVAGNLRHAANRCIFRDEVRVRGAYRSASISNSRVSGNSRHLADAVVHGHGDPRHVIRSRLERRRVRDALMESKTPIYPVRMAAERAWDAAHGEDVHYTVGKEAERAKFAARFLQA